MSTNAVSTLDQANEHANNAAEYSAQGLLKLACEEHKLASEAFQKCINHSTDEHTKGTLQRLHDHHFNAMNVLTVRVARLRREGKDPDQPQVPPARGSSGPGGDASSLRPPQGGRNLESSTGTVDESFMVLNQQAESSTEDSPFDLFWKVTGEIMVNLSQPMSFPAAAMAALDAVENRSTSSAQGPAASGSGKVSISGLDVAQQKQKNGAPNNNAKQPGGSAIEEEFRSDDDDYDSLDDFCLVPSSADGPAATSLLKKENAALKAKLEAMEKQMASVHRQITLRNEQDQHLRDNIALARKEAQRAMASSTSVAPSAQSMMNLMGVGQRGSPPSHPAVGRDREAQLLRRIRELEEDGRNLRLDNEKLKATIAKFRERWERLKESAKRKKSVKATEKSESSGVRERIDEEPEAEDAAAAEDNVPHA